MGSSPLARGKLDHAPALIAQIRLIPARAGKTRPCACSDRSDPAHPRSRGENVTVWTADERAEGSSPLARGKPEMGCLPRRKAGLIPARAGKTQGPVLSGHCDRAHPRSRGENPVQQGALGLAAGSSPLARGKQNGLITRTTRVRLIPARAGKTRVRRVEQLLHGAHPRSRGENRCGARFAFGTRGSSPLARGKRAEHGGEHRRLRLIPARAGKT